MFVFPDDATCIRRNTQESFLYSYIPVITSRRMRWVWHVARMGESRGACRVLVRKSEGKRSVGGG